MKLMIATFICLTAAICFGGCAQQGQAIEDIVAAYPDHAKVVFENDYVKAVEFTLQPGDKLPLHKSGPRAIYSLSDYKIKWTEGGLVSEKEWQKGNTHWHNVIAHAVENIGDTDANYLVVARKKMALPETGIYEISQDASQLDSEHANIILNNKHVRIIEVKLAAGESQPIHPGINRLIYPLTSYHIQYSSDKMGTKDVKIEAGDAHWHEADEHVVDNMGETEAHYLILAFKK